MYGLTKLRISQLFYHRCLFNSSGKGAHLQSLNLSKVYLKYIILRIIQKLSPGEGDVLLRSRSTWGLIPCVSTAPTGHSYWWKQRRIFRQFHRLPNLLWLLFTNQYGTWFVTRRRSKKENPTVCKHVIRVCDDSYDGCQFIIWTPYDECTTTAALLLYLCVSSYLSLRAETTETT